MKIAVHNKPICIRLPLHDIQRLDKAAAYLDISKADFTRFIFDKYLDLVDEQIDQSKRKATADLYRITPLTKKSIEYFCCFEKQRPDGSICRCGVTQIYTDGQGFRELENPVLNSELSSDINCDPCIGPGAELASGSATRFEFDITCTEQEKTEFNLLWNEYEEGLVDQEGSDWNVFDQELTITAPVRIDLVDHNGNLLTENIAPPH